MINVVRFLNDRQVLLEQNGRNFIVSQSREGHEPVEVLVFPADSVGNITSWSEVGGEVGVGLEAYLERVKQEGQIVAPWAESADDLPF